MENIYVIQKKTFSNSEKHANTLAKQHIFNSLTESVHKNTYWTKEQSKNRSWWFFTIKQPNCLTNACLKHLFEDIRTTIWTLLHMSSPTLFKSFIEWIVFHSVKRMKLLIKLNLMRVRNCQSNFKKARRKNLTVAWKYNLNLSFSKFK